MSKIEVNTVEPQCGTTLTLGGSGDTVTLGTGASQSGFGRTGTVDWDTSNIKTSTFTAVNGTGYFVNTSGGAVTCNLPAGSAGAIFAVADYTRTFSTHNLTITPNGSEKIAGLTGSVTMSTTGQAGTFVYVDGTEGWINVEETSNSETPPTFICASVSGTCNAITTAPDCANFKLATFVNPGTFTVSSISGTPAYNEVSYIVVGGGGAGGGAVSNTTGGSGGGGAGGFRENKSGIDTYTASPLNGATPITVTATPYPIDVGGGGAGIQGAVGNSGNTSTFSTINSAGGGGGGTRACTGGAGNGLNGGSGGGGGYGSGSSGSGGNGNTPSTSPAQGKDGAAYSNFESGSRPGGGGGAGAGGYPANANDKGGNGGCGVSTDISGSSVLRAGGGAGGATTSGTGGPGGGADGNPGPAANAGTANTGGGGGGTSSTPPAPGPSGTSGGGGSGIVIIRYKFQ